MRLLQKEIMARYNVSSTIRHKGEKGKQREDGYAAFLREYLPDRYGVASGEVIPYTGSAPSPQCDVIIYDRMSFPVIGKYSTVQQVPLEAVFAVTEVKSCIDKAAIEDAQAKFDAIRKLPRCRKKSRPRKGFVHPPFFVLFGYRLGTSIEACAHLVRHAPDRDTFVVALDSGIVLWVQFPDGGEGIMHFGKKNSPDTGASCTLCLSLAIHLECLRNIDLGTYPMFELFMTP
jgi:hypothetical protein